LWNLKSQPGNIATTVKMGATFIRYDLNLVRNANVRISK
jgi:hypothetical protein